MHGRLKVRSTEEQEKARRLERLKKQKVYQSVTAKIFAKREGGEHDIEALAMIGGILAKNPDVYSLWNYRKEIFLHLAKSLSEDELSHLYKEELSFLESCLSYNPKSYGSWEHRCFVMLHTPTPDWKRELTLCNTFLGYDERNFHCWDYRRFVVRHSNIDAKDELDFTYEKIASNFSNYSSWHYRSKLLPEVHGAHAGHSSGLSQSNLLEEMELVQNAFFTDPNDQSAWFYHRWLLGRVENPLQLLHVDKLVEGRAIFTFSAPVQVRADNSPVISSCMTPSGNAYSTVWVCGVEGEVESVPVVYKGQSFDLHSNALDGTKTSMQTYFRHSLTDATSDMLVNELDSCQQLYELEPENKWVLLTIVLLMNSLDPLKYEGEITSHIDKLQVVDSCRRNYYGDLGSRFLWEKTLMYLEGTDLDLSSKHLTSLHHQHLLYNVTRLDLSDNQLSSVGGMNCLQKVETLILSNNKIRNCRGLRNMTAIVQLNLMNNQLSDEEEVNDVLGTCERLKEVQLEGNPFQLTTA